MESHAKKAEPPGKNGCAGGQVMPREARTTGLMTRAVAVVAES